MQSVNKAVLVQTLTYSELTAQLGISSIRELEDLIITECFYKGIITGKLDQQRRCLQVQYTSPHEWLSAFALVPCSQSAMIDTGF